MYIQAIKNLKQKLKQSVEFVTLNIESQKHSQPCYLNTVMEYSQSIENRLERLDTENKNLRAMMKLHQDNNSFHSFAEEIKKFEAEANNKKDPKELSPSRTQEAKDKKIATDFVRKTLRDRNKRMGRKRTESFHFSSLGESSSDEDNQKKLFKLKRKSTTNEFSGYKMQVQQDDDSKKEEEEKKVETKEETKQVEKEKEPVLIPSKNRRRIMSTDKSNDFTGLSPPSNPKRRARNTAQEDDGFGMMKGGGYKMSMKPEQDDGKSSPSEEDYFGCFNKNKASNARKKRVKSMVTLDEDEPSQELAESKLHIAPKIKYSIHSIIEEEKSKSSSSTSSIKSSDDLTFLFMSNPNKHKKSSF